MFKEFQTENLRFLNSSALLYTWDGMTRYFIASFIGVKPLNLRLEARLEKTIEW